MKVLFAGGGTAGHINPALAIAGYLKEKEPETEVLYIGAKGGMEERLVPAAGFAFQSITISGFQRKLNWNGIKRNVKTVVRVFTSSREAKRIIKEFQPDICVGTGGYVSGPVIRTAIKMGIPCAIHEQNAYPGVTNKMLAPKAAKVMLAVEDAKKHFDPQAQCVLTGNPVRQAVVRAESGEARDRLGLDSRPVILSFGGSLGARTINEAMAEVLAKSAKGKKYQHIHGYGQYGKWLPELLKEKGVVLKDNPQITVLEYINNMPECLAAADLVISRAGAITLSEIQAQGKASILIPSPNVAENHQYHNAMALVNRNAAVIIEEKDLNGEILWNAIEQIFSVPGKAEELGQNAREMAILDANERIYRILKEMQKR